jgi:hypothetical protein
LCPPQSFGEEGEIERRVVRYEGRLLVDQLQESRQDRTHARLGPIREIVGCEMEVVARAGALAAIDSEWYCGELADLVARGGQPSRLEIERDPSLYHVANLLFGS